MTTRRQFSEVTFAALRESKGLRIRAGAGKYAKDLSRAKSRDTTIEFVPLSSTD